MVSIGAEAASIMLLAGGRQGKLGMGVLGRRRAERDRGGQAILSWRGRRRRRWHFHNQNISNPWKARRSAEGSGGN